MAIVYETRWNGIHAWHRQKVRVMHLHVHDYVEMIYVRSNELHFSINFQEFVLKKGDVIFVFPDQIHGHDASDAESVTLLFPKNLPIYDGVFCNMLPESPCLHMSADTETDALFCAAAEANKQKGEFAMGITLGYISLILGRLLPQLSLIATDFAKPSVEQKLIEYCSLHYTEHITLSSVAKALGYSPTHLSHIFSEKFKIGFSKFITAMRIEDAKKMLRGDKAITQIALDCGFGSMRNFNRAFKEATQTTPSEYRIARKKV